MYNWDNSWNWSTKSLSSPSLLVLFLQLFKFLIYVVVCLFIPVWRLWLKTFSISSILFLQSGRLLPCVILCLHFLYSVIVFISSWWLCLCSVVFLSEYYSAASSSSFRNFLTSKFLSEEFIKITYSPPSSRYNALSGSEALLSWCSLGENGMAADRDARATIGLLEGVLD